jgi:hypothetical protein
MSQRKKLPTVRADEVSPMKKTPKQPAKNSSTRPGAIPSVPIEAVFSFLKGTKGTSSWTKQDFADTLKISLADAAKILPVIQMQGYINPYHDEWVTTTAGEDVSGARPPRFSPEKVEEALAALRERIKAANQDSKFPYKIMEAVAFGDFLESKPRVQPADVGIRLEPRKAKRNETPKNERAAERAFLKQLRAKAATVNVLPYQDWMSARTHRRLL